MWIWKAASYCFCFLKVGQFTSSHSSSSSSLSSVIVFVWRPLPSWRLPRGFVRWFVGNGNQDMMCATGFQLCGYVWMLFLSFLRIFFLNAGDKNVRYCLFVHFKPATNERPVQHARSCSGCTTCAQTRACDSAARQGSRGQGLVQRKGDHCGCICYVSFADLSLTGCLRDGKGSE